MQNAKVCAAARNRHVPPSIVVVFRGHGRRALIGLGKGQPHCCTPRGTQFLSHELAEKGYSQLVIVVGVIVKMMKMAIGNHNNNNDILDLATGDIVASDNRRSGFTYQRSTNR